MVKTGRASCFTFLAAVEKSLVRIATMSSEEQRRSAIEERKLLIPSCAVHIHVGGGNSVNPIDMYKEEERKREREMGSRSESRVSLLTQVEGV